MLLLLQDGSGGALGAAGERLGERRRPSGQPAPLLQLLQQPQLSSLRLPLLQLPRWRQALLCLAGDEEFRRQRERAARLQVG